MPLELDSTRELPSVQTKGHLWQFRTIPFGNFFRVAVLASLGLLGTTGNAAANPPQEIEAEDGKTNGPSVDQARDFGDKEVRMAVYRSLGMSDQEILGMERRFDILAGGYNVGYLHPDDDDKEIKAFDILRNVGSWPLPSIAEWREPVQKVEIIVHPLFLFFVGMGSDQLKQDWLKSGGNVNTYVEREILLSCSSFIDYMRKKTIKGRQHICILK